MCTPATTLLLSIALSMAFAQYLRAADAPANWSIQTTLCSQHSELLKRVPKTLGVRFTGVTPDTVNAFERALDFWAGILDMEWHSDDTRTCAIHIFSGPAELFRSAELARAHVPDRPAFRGLIAVNPQVDMNASELYLLAVHELGHLLGLRHNPNARSVMYFLCLEGPVLLDESDLAALALRHQLRTPSAKQTSD